jgi:hypothetical protein
MKAIELKREHRLRGARSLSTALQTFRFAVWGLIDYTKC